jgi:hypothetical protein
MDEAKLALEVTKGIKGLFQDLIAPDVKAIIAVLNSHTELLKGHSQKLDGLSASVSEMKYVPKLLNEHSQKLDKLSESVLELQYLPKILNEHGQKLDRLSDSAHLLDVKQTEILARLDLEKRVSALEKVVAEIKG